MKGSGKILILIAIVTCSMLFFVHLQVASVLVSFEIHKSSRALAEKQELLRRFQFKVDQLRAPRLLEAKMKRHDMGLALPNKIQVVEVPPVPAFVIPVASEQKATRTFSSEVTNFLGRWIQTAQAKTDLSS
jgi:cell division protein FtsL